jgi:pimeloyl-ACP methyl ester carboxylesterase
MAPFSRVDEIALIDVPTMLNLVRYNTWKRGKIVYIGHSLGTTAAMMYACEYQEHAKETIKLFIFMSPAYKLNNMRSPYRIFLPLMRTALVSLDFFHYGEHPVYSSHNFVGVDEGHVQQPLTLREKRGNKIGGGCDVVNVVGTLKHFAALSHLNFLTVVFTLGNGQPLRLESLIRLRASNLLAL